jgi:hypothetical protein
MISSVSGKLDSLGISTKTLAITAVGAVAAFIAAYYIIESLPEPMQQAAEAIAILAGALTAAAIAAAYFMGYISFGTAVAAGTIAASIAVAGLTEAISGATSASTAFSSSLGGVAYGLAAVTAAINTYTTTENARYQADIDAMSAYWDEYLGITKTALEIVEGKITAFYTAQETAAQAAYQTDVDAANAAYDQQLTDFSSYWSDKLGLQTTDLTEVNSEINRFYAEQTSDLQTAYNQQISDINSFYDDLVASTMTGLNNIRASRQTDLDNLELNMLLQKTALEDAHDAGAISDTEYQTQLNTLNKEYNALRSETSDHYRLQELQAEQAQTAAATTIEGERATLLTNAATTEATRLAAIETQKNTDLTTATQQYATITTTSLQTLNDTLTGLAQTLADTITSIEDQKNASLGLAYIQNETALQTHWDNLASINLAGVNTQIQVFSQYTDALGNMGSYVGALVSNFPTEYPTPPAGVTPPTHIPGVHVMQHGGVVTEPTFALLGEAGPEAIVPLGRGRDVGSVTNVAITINVEGSVDERVMQQIEQRLRNVTIEPTSSNAPATRKRIRLGSSRF